MKYTSLPLAFGMAKTAARRKLPLLEANCTNCNGLKKLPMHETHRKFIFHYLLNMNLFDL